MEEVNAINRRIYRHNEFIRKCQAADRSRESQSDYVQPRSQSIPQGGIGQLSGVESMVWKA
jgi:hypothetical protein